MNTLPADTYLVINKSILSDYDRKVLYNLYQPIIGSKAVSLYFTLWSSLDKLELTSPIYSHHNLITQTTLSIDEINIAREFLEALGLLKTYVKETEIKDYVYELYTPLTPYQFLNNPVLSVALYNNIGHKEFESIVNFYKFPKIDLKNYTEITSSFSDIYTVVPKEFNYNGFDFKDKKTRNIEIISKIDINSILSNIPDEYLNKNISKNIKDLIYKLSFIYNLDDDELYKLISTSIEDKKINENRLRKQAQKLYEFEHSGLKPKLVYKKQPEYLIKQNTNLSNKDRMIYTFENLTPYSYLKYKYNGGEIPSTEIKLLEYLAVELSLNPGVINVIIDYILRINNHKLTNNFVITVAAQFKKANITTVEDAMNLAEAEYKNRRNKKVVNTNKPSWLNVTKEKEKANIDEINEINKLLEGI